MNKFVGGIVGAVLLLAPLGTALAANPHFINANASLSGVDLVVSWKEAGLGDNQQISYLAAADATVTYVCVNNGGANPSAHNKTTVSGPVSNTGTFASGKNGQITASLTVSPPAVPAGFSCPNGQSLQTAFVSYSNIQLTDTTTPVGPVNLGSVSSGCLLPNVRGACT